jgi:Zn finger protein HypA/HybF involved in hydrogenase expression
MHEMSVALEVMSIAERYIGREKLPDVVTVGLAVGDESGVEIESLEFCLEVLLAAPPFEKAKARVERVAGDVLRVTYVEVDDGG